MRPSTLIAGYGPTPISNCHEDNDGGGKRHPLRKHHFLPLCVTVPVLRPLAS